MRNMSGGTFNLFVYGTLMSAGSGSHMLQGCQRMGTGRVDGILYDIDGEHPALVLYGNEPIAGEVWRCPWQLLARLDEYEGVGVGLFRRVAVNAQHENGEQMPCWIYVAGPKLAHKLSASRRIAAWPAGLSHGIVTREP
jgi:gamma-glutamylcyclotransferase (GGCT)/AIG2-like uncharacterized protein YtfP